MSFLLAFASFWAIVGIGALWPQGNVAMLLEGPMFKAGIHVGTIVFPNYATRGTNRLLYQPGKFATKLTWEPLIAA